MIKAPNLAHLFRNMIQTFLDIEPREIHPQYPPYLILKWPPSQVFKWQYFWIQVSYRGDIGG